ncbi:MAG: hypothetical protein Q8R48_08310 [Candidatus Omnitrophota bacterium]|nr:hypothetical protein [Candidatus Omnitrophota bacterium]
MINPTLNRRGFVLIGVVCLCLAFIVIILPLIAWSVNEFLWTTHSFMALRALNLADAGAELAVWEIVHNNALFTAWSGENPKTLTLSSFTDNFGETVGDVTISVQNTSPGNYLVTSLGFVPSASNQKTKKTVKVKVFPHALFNNAVFGYDSVTMAGGGITDSYNSAVAPYTPLTAGSNADVGTNGVLAITGNGTISGDLFVGPQGAVSGATSGNVTGETYYFGADVDLERFALPDAFITIPSSGDLVLAGKDTLTLPSNDYRYESVSVDAKASLTIGANSRIYVYNDFYIGGQATVFTNAGVEIYLGGDGTFAGQGIVNVTGIASNLQIYGLNSGTTLSFSGQNDFYGTVYAPESTVYMAGNANYYGAIVGGNVTVTGGLNFHYDEALAQNGPFSGYDIAYWQED